MHDPWVIAIALLLGTHPPAAGAWPAEFTRIVVAQGPADEPDLELPPLPPEPEPLKPLQVDCLALLSLQGIASARELAGLLGTHHTGALRALHRLRERGLVALSPAGWCAT